MLKSIYIKLTILLLGCICHSAFAFEPYHEINHLMLNELPVTTGFTQTSERKTSLNGDWYFAIDPDETGEKLDWHTANFDHSQWRTIVVPGAWDLVFGSEYFRYQGDAWYAKEIVLDEADLQEETSLRIRFGAVFLRTTVWINGVEAGTHVGGYTPFDVDIKKYAVPGLNKVVVKVNNEISYTSVPAKTIAKSEGLGWWPYGGITRDVTLISGSAARVFKVAAHTQPTENDGEWALSVDVGVFSPEGNNFENRNLHIELLSPDGTNILTHSSEVDLVPNQQINGFKKQFILNGVALWSHAHPENRYTLKVSLEGGWVTTEFGFRTITVADGKILLNNQEIFLKGISRHEDHKAFGPVQSEAVIQEDINLLKELNVNHIRVGHYPADSKWIAALAQAGISITEEIPVYQLDILQMFLNYDNAEQQLIEMIERDRNEPAILIWSLGNECWQFVPTAGYMFKKLAKVMNRYDGSRPSTYSVLNPMSFYSILPDFATPQVDVQSINQYYGWYYGKTDGVADMLEHYHKKHPEKPLVISEFGAGSYLPHSDDSVEPGEEPTTDHSYSPQYQSWFLTEHFNQMLSKDYVKGTMPWAFADFRMEWSQGTGKPHPVELLNLKGLVTDDRVKKPAFYTVSDIYQ